jgi:hypothetical protein
MKADRGWKPLPQLHSAFSGSKEVSSSIKLAAPLGSKVGMT